MKLLEIQDINKTYNNHKTLSGVSMDIRKQSIFGLLGPNGAGKTTLIRIITQIINADSGEVRLNGTLMQPSDVRKIGYLPEERGLYKKMKVGDQLLFLAGLKGLSKAQARDEIKHWFERLEIKGWWSKKIEDLSKGMAQKIQFIATVLHKPDLIILDEPFSGFDPLNVNLIKENILELRDKGATIIFSTHRMESVEELCEELALIHNAQKILGGVKSEIKAQYHTNTFLVEYGGDAGPLPSGFEVLKSKRANGRTSASILLKEGSSPNDLLQALIPMVSIFSFQEKMPTINDIFIAKVKERHPDA